MKRSEIYSRFAPPVHDCPELGHQFARIFRRRTLSECPAWETREGLPKRLQQLCYAAIADSCSSYGKHLFRRLDPAARERIIPLLSTELPLELSVPLIREESYWKQVCHDKLHGFDVEQHDGSHKRCFLERIVSRAIEQYSGDDDYVDLPHLRRGWPSDDHEFPEDESAKKSDIPADKISEALSATRIDCEDLVKIAKDCVFGIHVRQLKRTCAEDETFSSAEDTSDDTHEPTADHGMDEIQQKRRKKDRDVEDKKVFQVVDYLKFPLALPNLKALELRCLQECGIDFSWTRLDFPPSECEKLGKALMEMPRLRYFRLYESRIGDEGIEALVNHLHGHAALQKLDFSRNAIGADGAAAIAKVLKKNPAILCLTLADNKIGIEGARHLASSLSSSSKLQKIDLSMNEIGNSGALKILAAIKKGSALTSLNIAANGLTSGFSQGLAEFLRENLPKLIDLDVSCNHFGEAGGKIILDGLKRNRFIKELDLRLTGVPDSVISDVKHVLMQNKQIDAEFMPSPTNTGWK